MKDNKRHMAATKRRREEAGMCKECGQNRPQPEHKICLSCIQKGVDRKRVSRAGKKMRGIQQWWK